MPRELTEIFETDPLSLTRDHEDITTVIEGFRAMRHRFNQGDTRAGKVGAVPKSKALTGVDVSGLDLDLKI